MLAWENEYVYNIWAILMFFCPSFSLFNFPFYVVSFSSYSPSSAFLLAKAHVIYFKCVDI